MNPSELFWTLAAELQAEDPRVVEGTIMKGRCLRVGKEFLALADFKGGGMVVKLNRLRVEHLIAYEGGLPFAPAGRMFKEWVELPEPDAAQWAAVLREGVKLAAAKG
jgi:hypothetical protein